jgi:hypothetical protein
VRSEQNVEPDAVQLFCGLCCSGLRGGCEGEASVIGIMIPIPAADDAVFAWIRAERIDEWFF